VNRYAVHCRPKRAYVNEETMKERLMLFIDGTNLLQTLGKVINADFRADKPPEDAIYLAMMIVRGLIQRISVNADFYSPKLLRIYWFGSFQWQDVGSDLIIEFSEMSPK